MKCVIEEYRVKERERGEGRFFARSTIARNNAYVLAKTNGSQRGNVWPTTKHFVHACQWRSDPRRRRDTPGHELYER